MREETIGEILRKGRVAKNLTLEDVEEKTAIPSPHLLALELEKFKLIPKDEVETYLQQYAELVDVDAAELLKRYRAQIFASSIETAPVVAEDEKITIVPSHKKVAKTAPVSVSKPKQTDDFGVGSRSSRYKSSEKTATYLPIILLCLVALGILAFVSFVTWTQLQSDSNQVKPSYSVVHSSSSSSSSTPESSSTSESSSSEEKSLKMETEGGGSNLTVNLSNVTDSLTVDISLAGADSSWVSVSNSEAGDAGTLLSSTGVSSHSATLPAGTKTSVITLGVTAGVNVSINGQAVDTSALTSTTLSYITINIQ
ncbi:membrane associated protein [Streptococcus infantarius subsp. infantarius]|nr:membrane associated protein [Streptococcus infantarius subsp. infantarius]